MYPLSEEGDGMTPQQKQEFTTMLTAIEGEREYTDHVTRAICVLCRILLEVVPEPLPEIQRDQR